jgi:hypothetical protein
MFSKLTVSQSLYPAVRLVAMNIRLLKHLLKSGKSEVFPIPSSVHSSVFFFSDFYLGSEEALQDLNLLATEVMKHGCYLQVLNRMVVASELAQCPVSLDEVVTVMKYVIEAVLRDNF